MHSQFCAAITTVFQNILITPKKESLYLFSPPPNPWQPILCFLSLTIFLFWMFHVNRIVQYVAFCGWLISHGIISRVIYVVMYINTLFLWMTKYSFLWIHMGFPGGSDGKESHLQCRRPRFNPWVSKIPWRREWQPTPVFLPRESHGQRSICWPPHQLTDIWVVFYQSSIVDAAAVNVYTSLCLSALFSSLDIPSCPHIFDS